MDGDTHPKGFSASLASILEARTLRNPRKILNIFNGYFVPFHQLNLAFYVVFTLQIINNPNYSTF